MQFNVHGDNNTIVIYHINQQPVAKAKGKSKNVQTFTKILFSLIDLIVKIVPILFLTSC